MATPMFPLGSVLVPGMVMPLQIFEPRYREMMQQCVANRTEFGVVLIARGSEVGGDETRYDMGCLAEVQKAVRFDDGRWQVICIGTSRIQVIDWVADDPYPLANLDPVIEQPPEADEIYRIDGLVQLFRATLGVAVEMGLTTVPATIVLPAEPVSAVWKVCEFAPIGDQDRLKVLQTIGLGDRIKVLKGLIGDVSDQLKLELQQPPN